MPRRHSPIRFLALLLIFTSAQLLGACQATPVQPDGLRVLATTTFLADIAQNVAGERLVVDSLIPAGTDPHGYLPGPADVARIAASELLITNGGGYELFLEDVLQNADGERIVVTAAEGLAARAAADGSQDPHFWLDPNLVIQYVENIRAGLAAADPQGAPEFQANAERYITELETLDAWIQQEVGRIPPEARVLVTNHESLNYFADRYGFLIVGTLVTGSSSDAAASALELAALVEQIRSSGAPAIFLSEVENPDLAEQIASETGAIVVADLHVEALTDGPPAPTYLEMIRHNVSRIVAALVPAGE